MVNKVPSLRFPEFSASYMTKKVSSVVSKVVKPVDVEEDVRYTEIGIRSHGRGVFHKKPTTSQDIGNKRVFWIEPDLFIVNIVFAWEQAVAVTTDQEIGKIASHRFPMFKAKKAEVTTDYLLRLFLTARGKNLLQLASPGGAGRNKTLGQKEFEKLKLNIPTVDEQEKVASFFSAIDKKIDLLKQKHKQLVQYKKGVMQQIFSQQLRFKDKNGQDYPNWEIIQLQEIAVPIKRRANSAINNVMTISAGNGFLHQTDRFNQVIAGSSLNKYTHLKEGEFSYNRGNSKSYTYGCVYKLSGSKDALVPFVYRSFSLERGFKDFFAHLFEAKYLDRQLRRLISSSARMDGLLNIGEKDFYKVTVPFPCEEEQEVIAKFVSHLNKKIELARKQLEKTQIYKKGLLQQMFV